jgi:hypothetical protein
MAAGPRRRRQLTNSVTSQSFSEFRAPPCGPTEAKVDSQPLIGSTMIRNIFLGTKKTKYAVQAT